MQVDYMGIILILVDKGIKHIAGFPNQRPIRGNLPFLFRCRPKLTTKSKSFRHGIYICIELLVHAASSAHAERRFAATFLRHCRALYVVVFQHVDPSVTLG